MLWLLATNRVTRDSLGGGRWREPLFHFGAAGITALLTIIPVAGYGLSAPAGSVVQGEWCWVRGGWTVTLLLPLAALLATLFALHAMACSSAGHSSARTRLPAPLRSHSWLCSPAEPTDAGGMALRASAC